MPIRTAEQLDKLTVCEIEIWCAGIQIEMAHLLAQNFMADDLLDARGTCMQIIRAGYNLQEYKNLEVTALQSPLDNLIFLMADLLRRSFTAIELAYVDGDYEIVFDKAVRACSNYRC